MNQGVRLALIGLVPLLFLLICLYLFRPILLPFLVGMAGAYLLDPAADRLERLGLRRTAATIAISIGFFLALALMLLLLLPVLLTQAAELARALPDYLDSLRDRLLPRLSGIMSWASSELDVSAQGLMRRYWGQAMEVLINAIAGLLQSGVALLNVVSLLFITPVVTFYMLRDWDRMVTRVAAHVPPDYMPSVLRLAHEVDEVFAGFIRGQGMVCLFLALFYALGLWLVGLRYGLIIGLLTGFFSFIPYLGMAIGACVGLAVAAFQFQDLVMVGLVAGVFALGQFIEGNLISPRVVGDRIHLHPVWIIFAVLAGTVLFGFLGTLLAVPVAGVLGVLIRFGLSQYKASRLYRVSS